MGCCGASKEEANEELANGGKITGLKDQIKLDWS